MVESPIMANLALAIHRHIEALVRLQAEIDGLYAAVETKSADARNKLLTYRKLKARTETALDAVAEQYDEAGRLLQGGDILARKLHEIKAEHVRLSELAVQQADPESILKLQAARRQGKQLYSQIEKLKAEALPAELAETLSPG
ncbi:MAG TPA: hypothetical protein VMW24_06350 [Sedimentisphaerales bacterium]|nr:hypothetical protein [Sedimentisphaerales bacterium]